MTREQHLGTFGVESIDGESDSNPFSATRRAQLEGVEEATVAESPPRPLVDTGQTQLNRATDFEQRYEPGKVLGQGGMGLVRLHHDRQIGRHVAIKTMRADVEAYPIDRARFLREARVQGQLEHPSVVPVYDLAIDGEGQTFFTMRRVKGLTLEQIIERLQMGAPRAFREQHSRRRLLSAFSRLCLAVHYAHEHGVLHRDLKPGNIILGEFGEVYLLDWGLAGLPNLEAAGSVRPLHAMSLTRQTLPGAVIGTPGYMSPEQAKGLVDDLTPASDVYSLGAVLFELLTLTPLHPGRGAVERLDATLRSKRHHRQASARAPEQRVDLGLEEIVLAATEPEPDERYRSARALHEALEAYLDGRRGEDARRQESARQAEQAIEAARTSRRGLLDPQAQRDALRAATTALALDPENRSLANAYARLLAHTPTNLPKEVRDQLEGRASSRLRWLAGGLSVGYAAMFAYLPLLAASGVTNWVPMIASFVTLLGAAVLALRMARSTVPTQRNALATLVFSSLGLVATAPFFGPLILTPSLLALNSLLYAMYARPRTRITALAIGVCAVAGSVAAGALGLIPGEYAFENGALVIRSGALQLAPVMTYALLTGLAVLVMLVGAVGAARLRRDLKRAEQELMLKSWLLVGGGSDSAPD